MNAKHKIKLSKVSSILIIKILHDVFTTSVCLIFELSSAINETK